MYYLIHLEHKFLGEQELRIHVLLRKQKVPPPALPKHVVEVATVSGSNDCSFRETDICDLKSF